jgi:hypothetical protein
MKIQTKYIYLLSIMCSALLFNSCDEIDNPVVDLGSYRNDLYGAPPAFTPLAAATQKVLLEDFTGHDCGNCPGAHAIAKSIEEAHEEEVIVVAVHAGSLAEPFGQFVDDWRTPEGEYYLLTQIGTDLLPTGRVNRIGGASNDLSPSNWAGVVEDELTQAPEVDMQMEADYVEANAHLNVHVSTEWFSAATGSYKLVILITQDSIVAPQLNYAANPQFIPDYLHRHMLRGSVSGATGLTVATNPSIGSSNVSSYTMDWNAEWDANHVEIVALITNGDNGEVLNVIKKKLIE